MDYVFSDPHFGHTKLRITGRKKFLTDEEMNQTILKNYNRVITGSTVKVYWLGDLGDKKILEQFLPKMRGYKILILGNHDTFSRGWYEKYFDEVHQVGIFYNNRILLSHHPMPVEEGMINVHGHTHVIDVATGRHFNVSVERTNYEPVPMKVFDDEISKIEKPNRTFLNEWYAHLQKPVVERKDLILTEDGLIDVPKTKEFRKSNNLKEREPGFKHLDEVTGVVYGVCPRCEQPINTKDSSRFCKDCNLPLNWDPEKIVSIELSIGAWTGRQEFFADQNTVDNWKETEYNIRKRLLIYEWKDSYTNSDILDGIQWNLKIKTNKRELEKGGSNDYPKNFQKFLDILDFPYSITEE